MIVRQDGNDCLAAVCAMIMGTNLETIHILAGSPDIKTNGLPFKDAVNVLWCDAGVMPGLSACLMRPVYEETGESRFTQTIIVGEKLRTALKEAADKEGVATDFYAMRALQEHLGVEEEVPQTPVTKSVRGKSGAEIKNSVARFLVPVPIDVPALLVVRYKDDLGHPFHAVYWTGKEIHDPNFDSARQLEDYEEVLEWFPLMRADEKGANYIYPEEEKNVSEE